MKNLTIVSLIVSLLKNFKKIKIKIRKIKQL